MDGRDIRLAAGSTLDARQVLALRALLQNARAQRLAGFDQRLRQLEQVISACSTAEPALPQQTLWPTPPALA